MLEKCLGTKSWIYSIDRYFFYCSWRDDPTRGDGFDCLEQSRLNYENSSLFIPAMRGRLKISASPWVFAAEAFLSGWEIVSKYVPEVFIEDFGLVSTPWSSGLMLCRGWCVEKRRKFCVRLEHILACEITAARQAASTAAPKIRKRRRLSSSDQAYVVVAAILHTGSCPCYFLVRKGRSSSYGLKLLCRHLLLVQLTLEVKIHIRWIGTK